MIRFEGKKYAVIYYSYCNTADYQIVRYIKRWVHLIVELRQNTLIIIVYYSNIVVVLPDLPKQKCGKTLLITALNIYQVVVNITSNFRVSFFFSYRKNSSLLSSE